jgi:hypothetical protein
MTGSLSEWMLRAALAVVLCLVVTGAAMVVGDDGSEVCAESMGGIALSDGGGGSGDTPDEAIRKFVEFTLHAPELLDDEQAIVIDDETLIATLYEDGVMVAWFDIEQTASSGYAVGLEAYCTDGDDGPFLAKSFDPRGRLGIEVGG